ncbi:MAG TPA: TetR/AcrR family transcriptional regulator [Mycobacterium sp.]|nr:TetR/AcrR family transcriptional regulator [Mycobacterium sp.]
MSTNDRYILARPSPAAPRRDGRDTRATIEREAARLFGDKGFRSTGMREVAEACGITPGAFYNHFSTKDQLLRTIILRLYDDLNGAVVNDLRKADGDPRHQISVVVETMMKWLMRHPAEARIAKREPTELDLDSQSEIRGRWRALRDRITDIVRAGTDLGYFDLPQPSDQMRDQAVATAIMALIETMSQTYIGRTGSASIVTELVVVLCSRMVGASAQSPTIEPAVRYV